MRLNMKSNLITSFSDSENDVPDEEDEDDCPMCYDDRRYNVECAYCHTISRS